MGNMCEGRMCGRLFIYLELHRNFVNLRLQWIWCIVCCVKRIFVYCYLFEYSSKLYVCIIKFIPFLSFQVFGWKLSRKLPLIALVLKISHFIKILISQKSSLFTDFLADMKNSWVHWSTSGTHIKKFSLHWVGVLPLYPIWWVYKAIGGGVRWVVVVNVWRYNGWWICHRPGIEWV